MEDEKMSLQQLNKLHQVGFALSLDDFGTGYSSLAYLNELPIDGLKIDQKFIRDMMVSEKQQRLIRLLLHIGQQFGIKVVLEGVESQEQVEYLVSIGGQYFQGFYFSRPLSIALFAAKHLAH